MQILSDLLQNFRAALLSPIFQKRQYMVMGTSLVPAIRLPTEIESIKISTISLVRCVGLMYFSMMVAAVIPCGNACVKVDDFPLRVRNQPLLLL